MWSFIKRLFSKKSEESQGLKPVKVMKLSYGQKRSLSPTKKKYMVQVAITINDVPRHKVAFIQEAYNRDQAAKIVNDSVGFKVISAHQHHEKTK